jgi:hypothetical protein
MFSHKRNRRNCSIGVERLDERVSLSIGISTGVHPLGPTNPLSGPAIKSGNTLLVIRGATPFTSVTPTFSPTNPLSGPAIKSGNTLLVIR